MKRRGVILAIASFLAATALAQEPAPKPGPEHKKMEVMAGTWDIEGDIKPNPTGPGGKMSENEKCEWMEGGFFLVCHVDFKSEHSGSGVGLSVIGYSPTDKVYSYREFNSFGETMESKGAVDGDTWTWTNEEKMGDTVMKGRFTMKFTSPSSYTFVYEASPDGTKWTTWVDGKATKK